jgi:hypothetical protein
MTDEGILSNRSFWEHFFFLLCNEQKLREFAEVSQIPVEKVRAARRQYLSEQLLLLHDGTMH